MPRKIDRTNKKLLEKWQTWVTLAIAILTLMTLLVEVPQKIIGIFKSDEKKPIVKEQTLAGSVREEQSNLPLAGVFVYLKNVKDRNGNVVSDTTDLAGQYELKVTASYRMMVTLIARKEGFETNHRYATLGNTSEDIMLRRQSK